jgi:Flp pilus assembly protein TadG
MKSRSTMNDLLKRFGRCQSGNVAIVFALSAIPIFLALGASID